MEEKITEEKVTEIKELLEKKRITELCRFFEDMEPADIALILDEFEDENYVAMIPDLGISTNGKNVEEAYLYCKDYLRVYIENALSYDLDFNLPSEIGIVANKYKNCQVMLVDTVVDTKRFGSAD